MSSSTVSAEGVEQGPSPTEGDEGGLRAAGRRATIAVAGTAAFLVFVGTTVVTLAVPTLRRELGGGPAAGEWVVNGYTLAFAAILLGAGTLADIFGARKVFLAGLGTVAVGATASALANGAPMLIAAQFVQGAGAALLLPSSLTLVTATASGVRERARVIAVWGATGAVGMAAGPLLGGILITTVGWRSVFAVMVAIAVVIAVVTVLTTAAVPVRPRRLDVGGLLATIVLSAGLVFVMIEGPHLGWASPAVLVAMAAFVIGTVTFVLWERRTRAPLLPLGLARHAEFTGSVVLGLLFNFAFYGLMFALSLLLQQAKGLSALATGLTFLSLTGLIAVGNLFAPPLAHRFGVRAAVHTGQALFAAGLIATAYTAVLDPRWPLVLALLPTGFGTGLMVPTMTARLIESAPAALAGAASAAFNTSRQFGSAIGVAIFGALMTTSGDYVGGFRTSMIIAIAAVAVSAVITATVLRARRTT
ncbi:MAG TPA: MFS transporter [Streptosporangiaceae bacterium]|jgi:DHA2 family methylenomycin A resistance protein-like MFS transporter